MTAQQCVKCHLTLVWSGGKLTCPKKTCPNYGKKLMLNG